MYRMREGRTRSSFDGLFGLSFGWWAVAASFSAAAVTLGSSQYIFGLFVEPLESTFGWSRTQISASLSFMAVGGLTAPMIGWVMDRRGAKPVMVVSLSLTAASFLLRPLMSELWHLYALSLLQFLGLSGAVMLPAGRLVGIWFRRNRGRVLGLTLMGNNFGGLTFPLLAGLVLASTSWKETYLAVGVISLLVALFVLIVVRERPLERPAPASAGSQTKRSAPQPPVLTGSSLAEALRTQTFYILLAVYLIGSLPFAALIPQIIAHLTVEGSTVRAASAALSVLAGFGMGGKVVFGLLAERIPVRRAMMISFMGLIGAILLMQNPWHPAVIWVASPLFGLCMGSFGPLSTLIVQDSFGLRNFGSIVGLLNLSTVVSFAVGPLLGGLAFDLTESYRVVFLGVAAVVASGVVLLAIPARRPLAG